ncbi:MAG: transporter [Dehalococcoidia bacterium]|nr:transporter [Dehalococcoidia bacterium]
MKTNKTILILLTFAGLNLMAHDYNSSRPDSHAPINVMGEHTHNAGEWMLSYRYSYMEMSGLMNGDGSVSSSTMINDNTFSSMKSMRKAPTKMSMHMQMLGAMYAPSDKWTVMLMLMHHEKSMDNINDAGATSVTESDGWGDIRLSGLYKIYQTLDSKAHLNLGLSLPSGSVDEKNSAGTKYLGYPMQLGSGTWDLLPGITYLKQAENWSWGAQGIATIRLDESKHNYTLGNRFDANLWAQKPMNDHLSLGGRIHSAVWGNVEGSGPAAGQSMRGMMPGAREDMQGGFVTCLGLGANYTFGNGHRLAFEFVKPVYQNYDGYQMERDWTITLGWQYSW